MITIRQECQSIDHPTAQDVPSQRDPGRKYHVIVLRDSGICQCGDFVYRQNYHCKHIRQALANRCTWTEGSSIPDQTDEQRKKRICPRCGNSTRLMAVET